MKIFNTILTVVCGVALLASCDKLNETPSFSKSDSFVSFPSSAASITEDGGQIVIPVNMASINPMVSSVSYVLGAEGDTAEAGVDYEDTNESAVLEFDGESRSANIVINILPHLGEFTGDKTFSIELLSATGLNIGAGASFTVTINDIDHPLAAILGTYTVECTEYWQGPQTYQMTLTKDPKDINTVWCDGMLPMVAGVATYSPVFATVTKDESENYVLSFPCGQVMYKNYQSDGDLLLCELWYASGYHVDDASTIVFTQTGDVVFESTNDIGVVSDSYVWKGGFIVGERTAAGNKTVWTKN